MPAESARQHKQIKTECRNKQHVATSEALGRYMQATRAAAALLAQFVMRCHHKPVV